MFTEPTRTSEATATTGLPGAAAAPDLATRRRVQLVSLVLAGTAVAAIPGGLLWPDPAAGGDTYTYADIAPLRDRWWGLLVGMAVLLILNVTAQALAAMTLVRRRGANWVTAGGAVMWLGAAMQAVGVAGWAVAYFFATDPGVDPAAGTAVIDRTNQDGGHLFGVMIPGALLIIVGTVLLAVGLIRSRALPRWVPILSLAAVFTFVVPGNGLVGLVTAVPMAAASVGLAYYTYVTYR